MLLPSTAIKIAFFFRGVFFFVWWIYFRCLCDPAQNGIFCSHRPLGNPCHISQEAAGAHLGPIHTTCGEENACFLLYKGTLCHL